jgi:hypothetical protein
MTEDFAPPPQFRVDLRDALVTHAAALRTHSAAAPEVAGRASRRPAVRRLAFVTTVVALMMAAILLFRSGGTLRPAPATAASVLKASATVLDHQGGSRALGARDYFYSKVAVWWRYAQFSRDPYVVRSIEEQWRARDGRGRSRYEVVGLGGAGVSPRLPLARSQDAQLRASARPFTLSTAFGISVSYAQLRQLPTDPVRLGAALDGIVSRSHVARLFPQRDIRAAIRFEMLRELAELPTAASLRAALYRVLAETPGIRLLGRTRDSIGRSGMAVAANVEDAQLELILDPASGELLQTSRTLLSHSRAYGNQPPGLINRATYLASGIVTSTRARVR